MFGFVIQKLRARASGSPVPARPVTQRSQSRTPASPHPPLPDRPQACPTHGQRIQTEAARCANAQTLFAASTTPASRLYQRPLALRARSHQRSPHTWLSPCTPAQPEPPCSSASAFETNRTATATCYARARNAGHISCWVCLRAPVMAPRLRTPHHRPDSRRSRAPIAAHSASGNCRIATGSVENFPVHTPNTYCTCRLRTEHTEQ